MLTDTAIRNAKPSTKQTKLYDEKGLFLLVTPRGGKWWRFKYRFEGKEKQLSLGTYPDTGLKEARTERGKARKLLARSIDPAEHRKTTRHQRAETAENSFEVVAREWFSKYSPGWASMSFQQDHPTPGTRPVPVSWKQTYCRHYRPGAAGRSASYRKPGRTGNNSSCQIESN